VILFGVGIAVACSHTAEEYENSFQGFLKDYNKVYAIEELEYRFGVFKKTLDAICEHNAGNHSWIMGVNQFSDLTPYEFERIHLGYLSRPNRQRNEIPLTGTAANDIDWTTKGAVTPIKDQKQCGSCWAFSTVGSTESSHFLTTGNLVSLSEQQLVDCSGSYGNQGCNGGLMDNAFKYYLGSGKGAAIEDSYPYTAKDGRCKTFTVAVTIKTFTDVKANDEDALASGVTLQPVSVAVDARKWQSYKSGIFDGCGAIHLLDHGVLAVGFDADSWKVKNSWGTSWGEKGFIRVKRGSNECGIAKEPSFPTAN